MKRTLCCLLVFIGSFTVTGFCGSLYDDLSRKASVKIFVSSPTDSTPQKKIRTEDLKKKIEEALAARKSVRFTVVQKREEAEIAVDTEAFGFYWTDHDPVDMLVGIGAVAMDAAVAEDFVRAEARMTVTDVAKGRALWKEEVMASITKEGMPEGDAAVLVNEKIAKEFVTNAFGKKKDQRR